MHTFDVVVIGSGPGGYRAAVLAALRGLKALIVEEGAWGGTCLNRGCVPKKDWFHTARILAASRDLAARGVRGALAADPPQAWRHQRQVVETVRGSYVDYLQRLGVVMVEGRARFSSPSRLEVGGQSISAGHVIVATGSRPWLPPQLPAAPGRILTTDDLFDHALPAGKKVAVLGSGAVGTEMAFILAQFGLEVVWLTGREPMSESAYSESARAALREALFRAGVGPKTGQRIVTARVDDGGVTLALPGGAEERVDWVLAGTGRRPNTQDLDLDLAHVTVDDQGYIKVDAFNQAAAGIYAIGDVANPGMSANHALADATVAISNIIKPGSRRRDNHRVPEALYSALELARVGWKEERAEAMGLEPATGFASFDANPAALAEDERGGFLRIIADMDSGRALGAEIAGRGAAELISLLGLEFGAPQALSRLATAAYNHPTRAEEILNAVETLAARWGMSAHVFPGKSPGAPAE
ncbi:MAG: dihydrolipoyl dehydrogenase family protein [Burkholderiales bacterium]